MAEAQGDEERVLCPVCAQRLPASRINAHLDSCLQPTVPYGNGSGAPTPGSPVAEPGEQSSKKRRLSATPAFPLFQKTRPGGDAAACPSASPLSSTLAAGPAASPQLQQELDKRLPEKLEGKPLADKMRPSTLEDYMGQSKVLGANTMLRSLLESNDVPSIILWGPPGCGKTTLAHIIAKNSKKHNTRFVSLSATSASTNDVREVIKQAQNEQKLFKRKTILFVDEIHRFNKSQQDTFLPHVECGTITLIGATTENPSFQVNSALLSRCRVIVLEKLSVEAMQAILMRAVNSLGIRVLDQDGHTNSENGDSTDSAEIPVYIEEKALSTLAHLCDGDARTGLNGLQLAVQARLAAGKQSHSHISMNRPNSGIIIIMEDHVKEGLQRSHILYDKAGEEHYNCISALHKSMRGSDASASLYWLARMLEGGEDPLYVARRLVRFASEDVGLADPSALTQAVAAFQGCHLIGMPECEVLLAQCVIYLARAPKSIEVYSAYQNVKNCLKNHHGPLPPVPLHLRNAPTKLMKGLGYAKGYKYNPVFKEPVAQDYLPEELKGMNFFKKVH